MATDDVVTERPIQSWSLRPSLLGSNIVAYAQAYMLESEWSRTAASMAMINGYMLPRKARKR